MAELSFLATNGVSQAINNLSGSGLGFYGTSFGQSVNVGSWQGSTYITNSAGSALGPQVANVKFAHNSSGIVGSNTDPTNLLAIPNYQATLNIRFTHGSVVATQNQQLRIYDRVSIAKAASGVSTKVAETAHPGPTQVQTGSGSATWVHFSGHPASAAQVMNFAPSPGISGLYNVGGSVNNRADGQHDWYVSLSASPDTIGSKSQYALYFSCEFL